MGPVGLVPSLVWPPPGLDFAATGSMDGQPMTERAPLDAQELRGPKRVLGRTELFSPCDLEGDSSKRDGWIWREWEWRWSWARSGYEGMVHAPLHA